MFSVRVLISTMGGEGGGEWWRNENEKRNEMKNKKHRGTKEEIIIKGIKAVGAIKVKARVWKQTAHKIEHHSNASFNWDTADN